MMNVIGHHPKPAELLRYSEGLVDGRVRMAPEVVRHVSDCKVCRSEVDAMRRSLEATTLDNGIEPSKAWTQTLLMEARRNDGLSSNRGVAKALMAAAALLIAVGVSAYRTHPGDADATYTTADAPAEILAQPAITSLEFIPESNHAVLPLMESSLEETVLQSAVLAPGRRPTDQREAARLRAIQDLIVDIDEGLATLEANPGLVSARMLVNSSRERKRELLKAVYLERSL